MRGLLFSISRDFPEGTDGSSPARKEKRKEAENIQPVPGHKKWNNVMYGCHVQRNRYPGYRLGRAIRSAQASKVSSKLFRNRIL